ncbi:MAG: DUF362 domain-containing protein [Candidatus Margulisiibacteriota bacterium]
MTFDLDILTPEKELFSGKAEFVAAQAVDGEIGILAGHAPLVSVLGRGAVRVTLPGGEKKEFPTEQGLIRTAANRVTVLLCLLLCLQAAAPAAKVYVAKTADRAEALKALFQNHPLPDLSGKKVIIKPNFNSDDPYPATTHLDTLRFVIRQVKAADPASITILERSGMGDTDQVLLNRGVYRLVKEEQIKIVNLDKLPARDWVKRGTEGTHWKEGFLIPRELLNADYVVNLACLKTHRFGGDFTLSLKNNVGLVAKWGGTYNYMWELHTSPSQRLMIAEINQYIPNHLVIIDGLKGFATEGPEKGRLIEPNIMILSEDRVAADVVGVGVLRSFGTTPKVMKGRIFDQEQIKRAAELGVGVKSAEEIELIELISRVKPFLSTAP